MFVVELIGVFWPVAEGKTVPVIFANKLTGEELCKLETIVAADAAVVVDDPVVDRLK